ncbi:argininosuccinate synthase [Salmonella enterica]|nr:argininosuccinate synthase [Salmonella enterica]EEN5779162.1 argininosuccinate synthase [Salmonella enterica]
MNKQQKIRSFADLEYITGRCKRILTLFSGGLDSSYVLSELAKYEHCEVIALTIDMREGVEREDLANIAGHFGARSIVIDGREIFAREAVLPALRCNAQYMGLYPISASLSRPLICRIAIEVAAQHGCDAIIHTANQSQNSLRRLNGALRQLGFDGFYGSPYEYSALTRQEKLEALQRCGLSMFEARGTSGDANLWCREFESGWLDNPEDFRVPAELFTWTAQPMGERGPARIAVRFEEGVPVSVDGVRLPLVELIAELNHRVGAYGIGRYCGLEHLDDGEKVLEVREAPAACLLMNACRHLEMATLDPELLREKISLEQVWVREAIEGRWFSGLKMSVEQFINQYKEKITGDVEYILREGVADACSIRAQQPLYLTERDEWEKEIAAIRGARTLKELEEVSSVYPHSLVNQK